MSFVHSQTLHGGIQLVLTELRRKYWILGRRNFIRKVIMKCVICARHKGRTAIQLMADLPESRVISHRPFLHTGMDLCGPIYLRTWKIRGSKIYKGYIIIFICMSVKAVHLEPVIDESTEAFLMAFQRFVARRGFCSDLYSDNGRNFVGARRVLSEDEQHFMQTLNKNIMDEMTNQGVNFHFNPPSAPSFGGLWERNIKSLKHHLKRVIGEESITYDELATLLARIESFLNSRPLLPITDDPDDFNFLTPGHYLIGGPLTAIPEPNLLDQKILPIYRYRTMQKKS